MRVGSVCHRIVDANRSGARVVRLSSRKYPEKDRYPTCSIMVWAGIMINGRTRLRVVANGTMTGQRYIDEVLLPHVRLFRGAVGDKFVFMDDNATCHRTLAVQDCLDSEVAGRNYPPTNKNTLIRALTEEWDKLPQQLLDNVVQRHGLSNHARDAVQDIATRHSLGVKDSISITKHDDLRHHYKVRYPQSNFWAARYMRHQHLRSRFMSPGRRNTGLTTPRHAEYQIINLILGNITPLIKQCPPKFRWWRVDGLQFVGQAYPTHALFDSSPVSMLANPYG
ncbi:uncharacterized protein TNCV_4827791 [Trichonephila clavipes]|uniref:Transposase n=1 Tax=Trichonephila clavipes TaxID=2585209 RepID=A0A8X6SN16_TRICX|nr:uncharacterized protein TNCV_4827791 [Trichonephila clavipes]